MKIMHLFVAPIMLAMMPTSGAAQTYYARERISPLPTSVSGFTGRWTQQDGAETCDGPSRIVPVTTSCTGGTCDPSAKPADTSRVVGSCRATCTTPVAKSWFTPPGQSLANRSLGTTPNTTGWQARFRAICEADTLPHVGCYAYGTGSVKAISAREGGYPGSSFATDGATTCSWN